MDGIDPPEAYVVPELPNLPDLFSPGGLPDRKCKGRGGEGSEGI